MVNVCEEFRKQYQETYICVEKNGKRYPLLVSDVEGDKNHIDSIVGSIIAGKTRKAERVPFKEVSLTPPELGCLNFRNQWVVYSTYSPLRQWKRGFRRGRIYFRSVLPNFINELGRNGIVSVDRMFDLKEDIWNVFNPENISFEQAIREVREGKRISCAFDKHWWVGLNFLNEDEDLILGYKAWPVGRISEGKLDAVLSKENYHLQNSLSFVLGY